MASRERQGKNLAQGTRLMREYLLRLLKPGDILVYSGSSVLSRLIKLKTYSEWTHARCISGMGGRGNLKKVKEHRKCSLTRRISA